MSSIQECDKPVIVAVHGLCLGAGIDIMSAADVRFCAEGSIFAIKVRPMSSTLSGLAFVRAELMPRFPSHRKSTLPSPPTSARSSVSRA